MKIPSAGCMITNLLGEIFKGTEVLVRSSPNRYFNKIFDKAIFTSTIANLEAFMIKSELNDKD